MTPDTTPRRTYDLTHLVFSSTSVVLPTFGLSLVSPIGQPARNRQIAYAGCQWAASRMRASLAVKRGCPRARSSQQRRWSPSGHRPLLGTLSSDLSSHACSLNYETSLQLRGLAVPFIESVALTESRRLVCCGSYHLRSGSCRKLTYAAERRNSFSSLPLVGIDRTWPASLANLL
jgi:hypothetical protein